MVFQTDLWLMTAIKAALIDMRKNLYLLEDAYANLISDPLLNQLYGKKEVERLKAFIQKDINVFVEHRIPDLAKFPAIVIKIGGAQEDAPKDALGDSYQKSFVDPAVLGGAFPSSNIVLGPITPISYDSDLGQMTFGPDVNLVTSNIFETQFVYDSINDVYYPITLVLGESSLTIEQGAKPNLTNMYIKRTKQSYANIRKSVWFWETTTIDLMTTDANDLMYLFTILMYIFIRYKNQLFEPRNFAVYTMNYSELFRASSEDDPNNIYGRTITIRGRVENSAIVSTKPIIDGTIQTLLIDDMTSAPGALPLVEGNIWEGQGDVPPPTGGVTTNANSDTDTDS